MDVLVFEIGDLRSALPISDVLEIVRAVTITRLPGTALAAEGVINLRGTVVPVLDVRKRLTMPAKPLDQDEYLIVGRAGERTVAMRVDRVTGIEEIAPTDLVDPAGMAPGAQTVVGGVVKRHDGLMLIHDLQSFLSRAEAAALDEAVAATTGGGQAA